MPGGLSWRPTPAVGTTVIESDYTGFIIVAAAIGGAILVWWQITERRRIRTRLEDPNARETYAEILRAGRFLPSGDGKPRGEKEYRNWVGAKLAYVDRLLGPTLVLNLHGLGICIACAMLYGALLFGLGWIAGFDSKSLQLQVLPTLPGWHRILLGCLAAFLLAATGWSVWCTLRARSVPMGCGSIGLAVGAGALLQFATTGTVWPIAPGAGTWGSVLLWTCAASGLVVLVFAAHGAALQWPCQAEEGNPPIHRRSKSGVFMAALCGLAAAVFISVEPMGRDAVVALFVILLPLCNGIFDWISLGVSRWLLSDLIARPATLPRLAKHVLVDLVVALLLMLCVAAAIPAMIEWSSLGVATDEAVLEASEAPGSRGLWLLVMVVSTLGPTVLHVGVLLFAAVLSVRPTTDRLHYAERLEVDNPDPVDLDDIALFLTQRWRYALGVTAVIAALCVMPTYIVAKPLGMGMAQVATRSGLAFRTDRARIEILRVVLRRMYGNHSWRNAPTDEETTRIKGALKRFTHLKQRGSVDAVMHFHAGSLYLTVQDPVAAFLAADAGRDAKVGPYRPKDVKGALRRLELRAIRRINGADGISKALHTAHSKSSGRSTLYAGLARTLLRHGSPREASAIIEACLAREPEHWQCAYTQLLIRQAQGRLNDVVSINLSLLERRPDDFGRRMGAIMALLQLGRFDTALEHSSIAQTLRPQDRMVHRYLATAHLGLGQFESFDATIAIAAARRPDDGYVDYLIAIGALRRNQPARAVASLDTGAKKKKPYPKSTARCLRRQIKRMRRGEPRTKRCTPLMPPLDAQPDPPGAADAQ